MRSILFLSVMNGSGWGGSEEQWYQTALWMCMHDYKVGVCVFDWEGKKSRLDELKKHGCSIYLLPKEGKGILGNWQKQKKLNAIPFKEYDLVYVNQGGWKDIAHGPFKKLYKKLPPYALSFHNYHLGDNLKRSKISILNEWIKGSLVCIAATKVIYEMLENEYKIFARNKEVSYSPITFTPPQHSFQKGSKDKPAIFVVLAALDVKRKAQDVLVKCFGNAEWRNRSWQLHLYGEGQDRQLLEMLIKELKLEDNIYLKGYTNNVQQVLKDSAILIQATHIDAMPISVIEAMAMSVPCIVSNIGDMPEWVQQDYNGFISTEVNEASLGLQLENAWNKKDEWAQMGMNAYETFLKKYPQPYEEKFVQLLDHYFAKRQEII